MRKWATSPDLSWRTGITDIAEEELLRLQREVGANAEILLEAGDRSAYLLGGRACWRGHTGDRTG